MKRFLLWILAFMGFTALHAQDVETGQYEARIAVRIRDGMENHDDRCTNKYDMYTTITGQAEQHTRSQNLNPISNEWKYIDEDTLTLALDQKLTWVQFYGERNWRNWAGCKGFDGWAEILPAYTGCLKHTYSGKIPYWDAEVTINIYPKTINLYYFNSDGAKESSAAQYYLPESHPIQIKATQGFPSAVYGWQYQIGEGAWQNFPNRFSGSNTLTFSGNDLPNVNFVRDVILARKSVKVRVSYGCGGYSKVLSLIPLLSAPRIMDVVPTPPSCAYLGDGKLTIVFDRNLYPGETVNFTLDGIRQGPENIGQLATGNTFTLEGLPPFTGRVLSFTGRFNGLDTYTDNLASQSRTVSVPERRPVTFTATPAGVQCRNGRDGSIFVTAQGGTETYTAFLYQDNAPPNTIGLTALAGNSFNGLTAGVYTVGLADSNGCEARDANGQPVTRVVTVAQPDRELVVSTVTQVEPMGFGRSDGSITVRAQDGTGPYAFYWTDANGRSLTPSQAVTEGDSQTSTLPGLGKGTYHVRVEDAGYALASPPTEENRCGCYDTLTIVLDEPPLLEVAVAEQEYVSCYGKSDGAVVAHATGGRLYPPGHAYHPYRYEWFSVQNGLPAPTGQSDSLAANRPAARYRVKVTDSNGITAWSSDFELVQPDPLKVSFNTSTLLCNGDRNGTAEALPAGGTPPYRYTWSTDGTGSRVDNLTDGWYSVVVTDARGCTAISQTEVKAPGGITVEAVVLPPACYNGTDGSIALTAAGGATPYAYRWGHGPQTASLQSLSPGTYPVSVTDANGCFVTREYTLPQPALLPVHLGEDRVLCKDQVLELDGTVADPRAQYQWTKAGTPFAATPAVRLAEAGTYTLRVTSSKGCASEDAITISRDEAEIAADFVVATRVPRGERVRIANISNPAPERVEWLVPPGAGVLAEKPEYLELLFSSYGEYSVGLRSFRGACQQTVYKPVRVVDKSELADYQTPVEPFIKQFMVTPNPPHPGTGKFTATVELRETADFELVLYSGIGEIITRKEIRGQSFSQADFTVPVVGGIYLLQLITPQGLATFKVIIK